MASSPVYIVNSPVSGTVYYAFLWAGCIPNNATSWTATVQAWSGPNGTGSLVATTLTAYNINYTTSTQENSFSQSGVNTVNATSSNGANGSSIMHPAGKYVGSGVGSLKIWSSSYTGAAYTPSLSSYSPGNGGAGVSVTITGNHFVDATSVDFNGVAASSFTVNSMTQITATVPAGATTGPIHVGNPAGTAASSTNFIPYNVPAITSFSPGSGANPTSVTISGSGFTGTTAVDFNGTAATSFTVDADTQITATVPVGATTGPIHVTNPAGTATSSSNYIPFNVPAITSFTPGVGAPGTVVTVSGSGFTGATAVDFNGTAATSFTVTNDTTLTATVANNTTTGPIHVTGPSGTGTSSTNFIPGQIYWGDASGSGAVHQPVAVSFGDPSGSGVVHPVIAIYIGTSIRRIW